MTQKTFADLNWELKQKKTRRERFFEEMTGGRSGYPVSVMLRIYFCQTWYSLSDDGMEDTLYD